MELLETEELKECFDHSAKNMRYLIDHYEELAKKYDRKWIAVCDGGVVEAADTVEKLTKAVRRHEHSECIVVEYVTTEPIAMFF